MTDIPRTGPTGPNLTNSPASTSGPAATPGDHTAHQDGTPQHGEPQHSATPGKAKSSGAHSPRAAAAAGKSTAIAVSMEGLGEQIGRGMLKTGRGATSAVRSAGTRAKKVAAKAGVGTDSSSVPSAQSSDPRVLHIGPTTDTWTPAISRAEGLVDDLVERAKPLALVVGLRLRRIFARAREEAEDIWAEAESLRALGREVDKAAGNAKATEASAAPALTLGTPHTPPTGPA